jgi:hypothetical protein
MQRLLATPVVRFLWFWVLLSLLCAALNESADLVEWLLAVGLGALVAAVGTFASRVLGVRLGLPRRSVTLLLVPVGSPVEEAWAVLVASAAPATFVVDAAASPRRPPSE